MGAENLITFSDFCPNELYRFIVLPQKSITAPSVKIVRNFKEKKYQKRII